MAVVRVAVVGEVDRDDAGEVRRPKRGDLERREAAVRDARHVHVAVAPRLRGQPLDRLDAVELLVGGVLVEVHALGRARAPDVDAGHEVAGAGEGDVGVEQLRSQLVLAIRDVVDDDGPRAGMRRGGFAGRGVHVGRQADAVAHRDQHVLVEPDAGREVEDGAARDRDVGHGLAWRTARMLPAGSLNQAMGGG